MNKYLWALFVWAFGPITAWLLFCWAARAWRRQAALLKTVYG